jgi:hypothetical protein
MYFINQLEEESKRRIRDFDINSMLDALVFELHERMRNNR